MSAPVHNRAQFEKAIERLIVAADQANRGEDLDRAVAHISTKPSDVSPLAAFVMVIDDDVRPDLSAAIDAFRRFKEQQGAAVDDDAVIEIMRAVYGRIRG